MPFCFLHTVLLGLLPGLASADWDACTSIAVGRKATVEGSGIATHNNDCQSCDPRVAFIPARDHAPDSLRAIAPFRLEYPRYVGAGRSATYAPVDGQQNTKPIGYIEQVAHTYAYWEAGYPLINEHGLGFGESTCGAQLIGQSVTAGGEALFSMSELMQVALERCRSARCAIGLMGRLAESHGFYGEDPGMPGAGESLTVVDRNETWIFHITGGLNNKSATWVSQRVPDDHVAVVANNFIIQSVDCKDTASFMCSSNIFSNARSAGLCEFASEAEFNWLRCYGTDVRYFKYMPAVPPIPYYTTLRVWRIQSLANPKVAISITDDVYKFPFSVPAAKKVSRTDIMNWTRDYYQGTEFDMSLGVMSGPFGNPNRLEGGTGWLSVPGQFARGISIPRTNYALIVEAKHGARSGQSIAWFATDQPLTSVFVPFFAASGHAAPAYQQGRQEHFSRDSAWWAFNFVSNWMNIDFTHMMAMNVGPAQTGEQEKVLAAVEALEAQWPEHNLEVVGDVQRGVQERLVESWWKLADDLIVHFSDGAYTFKNATRKALGYPSWYLQMIGFKNDFYKVHWVQPSSNPPLDLLPKLPATLLPAHATTNLVQAAPQGNFLQGLLLGAVLGAVTVAAMLLPKQRKVSELRDALLGQ